MAISIPRNPRLDKRHSLARGLIFDSPFVFGGKKAIDLVTGIPALANADLAVRSGKHSGQTPDFNNSIGGMGWVHPYAGALSYISTQILYLRESGGVGTGYGNLFRLYDSVNNTTWFGVENDNGDAGWGQRVNCFYTATEKVWSTPYPTNNIWYNYILTYDHTNKDNVPRVWYNGVAQSLTNRFDSGWTRTIVPNTIYIARSLSSGGWDGGILLVRAWKRILSDKEIGVLMADPTILYKKRGFFSFSNVPSSLSLISISDTGAGSDAPTIQATIPLSDTGSGTDTLTNAVSLPLSDTGSGVDTPSVSATIPVTDTGTGSELLSLLASISVSDTGSGVDALSLLATLTILDWSRTAFEGLLSKHIWGYGDVLPTFGAHLINPAGNTLTPTLVDDYINLSFSMTANANAYLYRDATSVTDYTVQNGDCLEYEVYWETTSARIALDFTATDGTALRTTAPTDQNGLSCHPNTDIGTYANQAWYRRFIKFPTSWVGKTINFWDFVCEADGGGTIVGRIRNARITNANGMVLAMIPVADTGVGADTLSILAQIALSDTGSGAEALAILASIVISDTGTGADQETVSIDTTTVNVSDTGSGVDLTTISAEVPLSDTGSGSESLAIQNTLRVQDANLHQITLSGASSNYFDGDSSLGISSTGSWTIEYVIENIGTPVSGLASNGSGTYYFDRTTNTTGIASLKATGGTPSWMFQFRYDDNTGLQGLTGTAIENKTTHIAMVRAYNSQLRLFVNGILVATAADNTKAMTVPIPRVGCHQTIVGLANASYKSIRYSNIARYSANFEPEETMGSDGNTVMLWNMTKTGSGKISDNSGNGRTGTINGTPTSWDTTLDPVEVTPSISIIESGSGVDNVYVSSFVTVLDSGVGVEALSIIANVAISDTGNAVEAVSLLAQIAISDTGLANEALAVLASISISDIGSGVDQPSTAVTIGLSDSGSGNDLLSILLTVLVSDTGTGVDEIIKRISETLGKFRGMLQYKSKTLALGKKPVRSMITRKQATVALKKAVDRVILKRR